MPPNQVATQIDVRLFGVLCDGINDDTAAIQRAANAMVANGTSEGSSLLFPPGPCLIKAGNIVLPHGITLEGSGADTFFVLGPDTATANRTAFIVPDGLDAQFKNISARGPSVPGAFTIIFVNKQGTTGDLAFSNVVAINPNAALVLVGAGCRFVLSDCAEVGEDYATVLAPGATYTHLDDGLWVQGTQPRQIKGTVNPSAGAGVAAPEGSIFQRFVAGGGELWLKTGAADTAWTMLTAGGGGGMAIGDPVVGGTPGSVLWVDSAGDLAQDNANFFWDEVNNRLGIGTNTPATALEVNGTITATALVDTSLAAQVGGVVYVGAAGLLSADAANLFWDSATGRLGIGTNAPAEALDVVGNGVFSGTLEAAGITDTTLTQGSVIFVGPGGALAEDNAQLFWDNAANRLGIGNAAPTTELDVTGTTRTTNATVTSLTATRVLFAGVGGALTDDAGFVYDSGTNLATLAGGLEIADSALAVSSANAVRFRSSGGVAQVSMNGAAYVDIATGSGMAIGGTVTGGTANSVLFVAAGPVLAQDNANFSYTSAGGLRVSITDASTNTTVFPLAVEHLISAGTPVADFGVGEAYKMHNSTPALVTAGTIETAWTTATAGSEVAEWRFKTLGNPAGGASALSTTADLAINANTGTKMTLKDARTAGNIDILTLYGDTTGVPAANISVGMLSKLPNSSNVEHDAGRMRVFFSNASSLTSSFDFATRTSNAALASIFRVSSSTANFITVTSLLLAASPSIASSSGALTLQSGSTAGTINFNAVATVASFKGLFSSGTNIAHAFTPANMTGQTLSVEGEDFKYTHSTKQWATGALTIQRFGHWTQPTIAFVGASTVSTVATVAYDGPPIAGTNATITRAAIAIFGGTDTTLGPGTAGFNYVGIVVPAHTVTITGGTNVTSTVGVAGLRLDQLTVANATAMTMDAAATLYIAGAPVGGGAGPVTITNPYAIWVDAGLSRFDGDGTHVFELPADATGNATAATGRVPVDIGGATKYLRYYDD